MARVFLYDIYSSAAKTGDMLFFNNQNPQVLANGSSGQVLQSNGFGLAPSWVNSSSSFITSVSDTSDINLLVTGGDLTANFANYNVSQFTNDSGYITSVGTAPTSLTTIGTSGAATLIANTLNIPNYTTGALVLLSTATASNSTTIDFTGLTNTYSKYIITFTDVVAATNGDAFWIRLGTGSTSWASGASDYAHGRYGIDVLGTSASSTAFTTGDGTDSKIVAIGSQLNTLNYTTNGEIEIYNPSQSSKNHYITGKICAIYNNAGNANFVTGNFGAYYNSTTAVTGVRILMSTGNITSGTFKLYGVV